MVKEFIQGLPSEKFIFIAAGVTPRIAKYVQKVRHFAPVPHQ
jgi:hypothetical protein